MGSRSSPVMFSEFFNAQRNLLARERQEEVDRTSLLLTHTDAKHLEAKGLALGSLGILSSSSVGLDGKMLVELERPAAYHPSPLFPPHNFRPGDIARIQSNKASTSAPTKTKKSATSSSPSDAYEGVVYRVSATRIVVALENDEADLNLPDPCRLVQLANSVTFDRMDKAIDDVERIAEAGNSTGNPLHKVLLAQQPRSRVDKNVDVTFFDDKMNPSQRQAVKFCLGSPEVACIHGPPGTGKTRTVIELILQFTSVSQSNPKAQRVLVCGASNLSVDNILERLLALPKDKNSPQNQLKITRVGHPARVMAKQEIIEATLDVQASTSDQAAIAKDVKKELEDTLAVLNGKKGKRPRGPERKKLWEDVRSLRKEYRQREGRVVSSVLSEAQVVLATCHTAGSKQLRNLQFDVVIIDEATQAMEAVCWVPILKGKRLILAGDPMQLPPTVLSEGSSRSSAKPKTNTPKGNSTTQTEDDSSDEEDAVEAERPISQHQALTPQHSLSVTLFHRLEAMYGRSIKHMLEIQYRMNDEICAFPSKTLYYSKLQGHEDVKKHRLSDLPNIETEDEDLSTPLVFFDTAGCDYYERADGDADEGSKRNENEATIAINWVERLISLGVEPSQVALITPYQAQVAFLTAALAPKYGPALEIGTVDGMQGREKEAIVISLVRSNEKREVGFLRDKRRLNVAMTRAKRHLCIVGDSSTVSHGGQFLKKWMAFLEENADVRYAGIE